MPSTSNPLWQRYEQSVRTMLSTLDPAAKVTHNQHVTGRLSGKKRQIDVLANGTVVGQKVTVAVECKRHGRPSTIQLVDQFIGKLLDIGADRGILYSYAGFTSSAVSRAIGSSSPNVSTIALKTPDMNMSYLVRAPGLPADLLCQDPAPQWVEEMDEDAFRAFLTDGSWNKLWS
ncbi:restriction endonuclease [Streptomyces sp. NBC_00233]|uniref:restriction endonuclease n=1 Tax=Streptomyces sp. NBC_00233 TaxID=2975686 RepID=UPI00225019C4|nr:restriction endonuclease [Streptomyces sp. NBC_00233]MCX5226810.1 restriction endonuclease [Streptomyces sp. NBC_00233]